MIKLDRDLFIKTLKSSDTFVETFIGNAAEELAKIFFDHDRENMFADRKEKVQDRLRKDMHFNRFKKFCEEEIDRCKKINNEIKTNINEVTEEEREEAKAHLAAITDTGDIIPEMLPNLTPQKEIHNPKQQAKINELQIQQLEEIKKLMDWVDTQKFTETKAIKDKANKHIYQAFKESHMIEEKFEDDNYRNLVVKNFRDQFKTRMEILFDKADRTYFLKYTSLQMVKIKAGEYKFVIAAPTLGEETTNQFKLYKEKFEKDYFPILESNRDRNTPMAWKNIPIVRTAKNDNNNSYMLRSQDIEEILAPKVEVYGKKPACAYNWYRDQELSGEYTPPLIKKQAYNILKGTGVPGETLSMDFGEHSEQLIIHSGNQMANNKLKDRRAGRLDIKRGKDENIIIFSKGKGVGKTTLIEQAILELAKEHPTMGFNMHWCDGDGLYNAYKNATLPIAGETTDALRLRQNNFLNWICKLQLLVIDDMEGLENKIGTQKYLMKVMKTKPEMKVIFISNKDINNDKCFPPVKGTDEKKRKGYTLDFLDKIIKTSRAEVIGPGAAECGQFLDLEIKKIARKGTIDIKRINAIAKIIPQPQIYRTLARDISNICDGGAKGFTGEMAKTILKQYSKQLYEITPDEIMKIVMKHVVDQDNPLREDDLIIRYGAYFLKGINPGKIERSDEEIAAILKIDKVKLVRDYIYKAIKAGGGLIPGIREDINKLLQEKQSEILAAFRS